MPCDEGMGSEISVKIIPRARSCQLGESDAKKCQKSVWLGDHFAHQGTDCRKKKISQSFPKCLQDGLVSSGYLAGCEKMEETEEQNTS